MSQDGHTVLLRHVLVEQGTLSEFSGVHRIVRIDVVVEHRQLRIAIVGLCLKDVPIKRHSLLLLVVLIEGIGVEAAIVLVVGVFVSQLLHFSNSSLFVTHRRI